jgi:hypothetical protein
MDKMKLILFVHFPDKLPPNYTRKQIFSILFQIGDLWQICQRLTGTGSSAKLAGKPILLRAKFSRENK